MAIGNNYDNNKEKQFNSPTVYSNYKVSNTEGFDPSALNFTFWNGMLKIGVSPLKSNPGDEIQFDYENNVEIYLTHIKARLLASEIALFKENPSAYNNVGVNTPKGLISISNGKEFGITAPVLIVRKIDMEGKIEASFAYQFKSEYYFAIRNYDADTGAFDKIYNNNIELDMLENLLIDYYHSMNGAIAYSVMEYGKYKDTRTTNTLNSMAEKLGVDTKYKGNRSSSGQKPQSIFNSTKGRTYSNADLDDIEELM